MAFAKLLFALHSFTLLSKINSAVPTLHSKQIGRVKEYATEHGVGYVYYASQNVPMESDFESEHHENVPMANESGDKRPIAESDLEELMALATVASEKSYASESEVKQPKKQPAALEQVLGCVGHGISGSVWIVETGANVFVARKKISLGSLLANYSLNDLKSEIYASASLSGHPSFPVAFEFFCDLKNAYIDYEVVSGKSLQNFLVTFKPLSTSLIRHFGSQILNAIDYLGKKGLIHCDLNPSNIMLTNDGRVKIIDFGMTILVGGSHDIDKDARLGFVAPEVHDGPLGKKADIWGWGMLMFLMASDGKYPCKPEDKHCKHIFWSLIKHRPNLENIIKHALSRPITHRPTAALLKHFSLFRDIDWDTVSSNHIPLHDESPEVANRIQRHLSAPPTRLSREKIEAFKRRVTENEQHSSQEMIEEAIVALSRWGHAGFPVDFQ